MIYDDVDRITDDKMNKAVQILTSDILSNGRDHATQKGIADIDNNIIIITNHEVNDYKRTKPMLTECNYVVLFPSSTVGKADETEHRQDRSKQRDRETDNNIHTKHQGHF